MMSLLIEGKNSRVWFARGRGEPRPTAAWAETALSLQVRRVTALFLH